MSFDVLSFQIPVNVLYICEYIYVCVSVCMSATLLNKPLLSAAVIICPACVSLCALEALRMYKQ